MPKRLAPLLLLLAFSGCSSQTPFATTIGALAPGKTIVVDLARGVLNVYRPAAGDPSNRFTVTATARKGTTPAAPRIRASERGITVTAADPLAYLLVRVPQGVDLVVNSRDGAVHVTDITGNARIVAGSGDVNVMLPGYAQVHVGSGGISVRMGSVGWPGTLRFWSGRGNVEVWIRDSASFHVHLHTANGTIFTDFNLRGTSQGSSETIDGNVNGGGTHGVDIETAAGEVRLLQLHPQP